MNLASCLLISVAFHVAILTLPLSLSESNERNKPLIPVVLLDPGDGSGQEMPGTGKTAGQKEHLKTVNKRHLASLPGPVNKERNLSSSKEVSRAAEVSDQYIAADQPRSINFREPVAAIGPVPFELSTTGPAGDEDHPGDSLEGLGEGSADGGELSADGGSRSGIGARGHGGTTVSGSIFAQVGYAHNPKPLYPERARREGWEGTVLLRVLVDQEGKSKWIEMSRSSGFGSLDAAAVETVKRWRFYPARYGERRIESWVKIPIIFRLSDYDRGS